MRYTALLVFFLALGLSAQNVTPHVWIVAIGVGKYARNFAALPTAPDGARLMATAVADAQPDVTTAFTLLTDAREEANRPTRENVLQVFKDLQHKVQPADQVIVYFCGHGVEFAGKSYLLLMNVTDITDKELLEAGSINLDWLREQFGKTRINCREQILCLDACRIEKLVTSGDTTNNHAPMTASMAQNAILTGTSAVTLHGCRSGESVYYSKNGPPFFTTALVEGLRGKAADDQGQVTMSSLARYISERLPKLVQEEFPQLDQHPELIPAQVPAHAFILRPARVIACPDFVGEYGDVFADAVQTKLQASRVVTLVERTQLNKALGELKLQQSGITEANAKELGHFLNAKYILVGRTTKAPGEQLQLFSHLIDVESGNQVPGVAVKCLVDTKEKTDWQGPVEAMTEKLLECLWQAGLTTGQPGPTTRDEVTVVHVPLAKLNGDLTVTTDPTGALVNVDEQQHGATTADGVKITNLPVGSHRVAVTCDGYEDANQNVEINAGEPAILHFKLTRMLGAITVKTEPPGAQVTVDDQLRGITTTDGLNLADITSGVHRVTVTHEDYRSVTQEVTVTNHGDTALSIPLEGSPGKLTITTTPPGATIYLNEKEYGTSQLDIPELAPGTYTLRVKLKGYKEASQQVMLAPNRSQTSAFNLDEIEKTKIEVTSDPPGASIILNGKAISKQTPATLTLEETDEEAQDVEVKVILTGYKPVVNTFTVKHGELHKCTIALVNDITGQTKINPKDGATMVWIPAGVFTMGRDVEEAADYEKPAHKVILDGFWMYQYDVTVAQYRKFCEATKREMPEKPHWGWHNTHPVVNVSWEDAKAYADWAEVTLPTEAQWERAARGGEQTTFVWGEDLPPPVKAGNFADETYHKSSKSHYFINDYNDGFVNTSPVGSFSPNAFGLYDMAGNVFQWCADYFGYYQGDAQYNPTGATACSAADYSRYGRALGKDDPPTTISDLEQLRYDRQPCRVVRGSSWHCYYGNNAWYLIIDYRQPTHPDLKDDDRGFRCSLSSPETNNLPIPNNLPSPGTKTLAPLSLEH